MNNLSAVLTSSMDSRDNSYNINKSFNTRPHKRVKKVKTKSFRTNDKSKFTYLKHSASSGSFNKLKAFEQS